MKTMKSYLNLTFVLFILLFGKPAFSSDSTFVMDTIETRQNEFNAMKNYYFENNKLVTQENYYSVFVRSPNHNVMENYLKYKKLNGSEYLITFSGVLSLTYILLYLQPQKINMADLWYLPLASGCFISVGIPMSIIRHNYKIKAITEFNKRKL
jgi:hypothetical protein